MNKMKIFTILILSVTIIGCETTSDSSNFNKNIKLSVDEPGYYKELAGRKSRKNYFTEIFKETVKDYNENGGKKSFIELFNTNMTAIDSSLKLSGFFKVNTHKSKGLLAINEQFGKDIKETIKEIESRLQSNNVSGDVIWLADERLININYNKTSQLKEIDVIKELTAQVDLAFWHTYKNTDIGNLVFQEADSVLSNMLYPGYRDSVKKGLDTYVNVDAEKEKFEKTSPLGARLYPYADNNQQWVEGSILGYSKISDTAVVNEFLAIEVVKNNLPRDLAFMWERNSSFSTDDNVPLYNLYLIKNSRSGKPELDGTSVESALQDFETYTSKPMVSIRFSNVGAIIWGDITEQSAQNNTGIAITVNNKVFSAPVASARIEGGSTQITGGSFAGENGISEAQYLANVLGNYKMTPFKLGLHSSK